MGDEGPRPAKRARATRLTAQAGHVPEDTPVFASVPQELESEEVKQLRQQVANQHTIIKSLNAEKQQLKSSLLEANVEMKHIKTEGRVLAEAEALLHQKHKQFMTDVAEIVERNFAYLRPEAEKWKPEVQRPWLAEGREPNAEDLVDLDDNMFILNVMLNSMARDTHQKTEGTQESDSDEFVRHLTVDVIWNQHELAKGLGAVVHTLYRMAHGQMTLSDRDAATKQALQKITRVLDENIELNFEALEASYGEDLAHPACGLFAFQAAKIDARHKQRDVNLFVFCDELKRRLEAVSRIQSAVRNSWIIDGDTGGRILRYIGNVAEAVIAASGTGKQLKVDQEICTNQALWPAVPDFKDITSDLSPFLQLEDKDMKLVPARKHAPNSGFADDVYFLLDVNGVPKKTVRAALHPDQSGASHPPVSSLKK